MAADERDICSSKSDSSITSTSSSDYSSSSSITTSTTNSSTNPNNLSTEEKQDLFNGLAGDTGISDNLQFDDKGSVDVRPVTEKAKSIIDQIFDPLAGKKGSGVIGSVSRSSASVAGYNEKTDVTVTEISYDIINLDPDNIWDIYYRDDDPVIWDSNRKSATMEVNGNIQKIHETIITKIRDRIKIMFGDSVLIRVENCFMGPSALLKYRLKSDHLFSQGRAVLFSITGEKASFIYEDIMDWCDDDTENDIKDPNGTVLEPFDYGMMKLCNTNAEKQLIYITLPFTQEELDADELLLVNKSNFYYTESNKFMMAPESSTPTKIFPAYQPDNEVEDLFNKIDDLDDEINKLEKQVQYYKQNGYIKNMEKIASEKYKLELEKEFVSECTELPEIEKERIIAEKINEKFPTDKNKADLEEINKKIEGFPLEKDEFDERIIKENVMHDTINIDLSLDLTSEMDIGLNRKFILQEQIDQYFLARKLIDIYKLMDYYNGIDFNIDSEFIDNELSYRKSIYNAEKNSRREVLYQQKVKELYPNGIPENTKIPYIEVKESDVDMSDMTIPTKESIYDEYEQQFNESKIMIREAYNNMNPSLIENKKYPFSFKDKKYSKKEINQIEKREFEKFDLLTNLVKKCELVDDYLIKEEIYKNTSSISELFDSENINPLFRILFSDKSDINIIQNYYYERLKQQYSSPELLKKIDLSIKLTDIFREKDFNITIIPASDSSNYSEFIMTYLECELKLYTELSDQSNIDKLMSIKSKYLEYAEKAEYNKMKLSDFKTDIFQFTDIEYDSVKQSMFQDNYSNENLSGDERAINKIAYLINELKIKTKNMRQYIDANEIGKNSYLEQCVTTLLSSFYNDTEEWISKNFDKPIIVTDDTINDAKLIDSKLKSNTLLMNNYFDAYNKFISFVKYNKDIILEVDNYMNSIELSLVYKDYGIEFSSLHEQIAKLSISDKEDKDYNIRLKSDRIILKRELSYIISKDIEKKITHYLYEESAAIDFGKINRYNQITIEIMPELIRLKELKENFIPIDRTVNIYESKKLAEKERLAFLYQMDPYNKSILYRYMTIEITMDYESSRGIFENLNIPKEKKYKLYLEEILKELNRSESPLLDSEKMHIQKEIDYINNFNNEREIKKTEIIEDINKKKQKIQEEMEKRKRDKEYLHEQVWKEFFENEMKLKYKNYVKIEYLPSTGVKFIYPFYLYEEFKQEYTKLFPKENISIYEIIDSYREYCKGNFNLFEREKNNKIVEMHSKWLGFKYNPDVSTMTTEINTYILVSNDQKDENLYKKIYNSLYKINGFMGFEPILLSDNNREYNVSLMIKIRRTLEGFKTDINKFVKEMYKTDPRVEIEVLNKEDIL